MEQITSTDGKKKMKCGNCGLIATRNATKLVHHAAKKTGGGIKICPAILPPEMQKLYDDLFDTTMSKAASPKGKGIICTFLYSVCLFIHVSDIGHILF